ncbi:hypothetical protein GGF31_000726 [Allomyces arbusculus]|nr:hypothetical protein GGF31_000726 [Allomyces arbusculus]
MADTHSTPAPGQPARAPTAETTTSSTTPLHPARAATHVSHLPAATIRRLGAGQVITGVESAVKELVENALDAGATAISVHLVKHGAQSLAVMDNGSGIAPADFGQVAKRHHTSKIARFEDLESTTTLGFRGEALYSLAAVSQALEITTKTKHDALATTLQLDQHGNVKSTKAAPGNVGTSVTVRALFFAFPILVKQKPDIKILLHRYALAHPAVRFSLRDDKESWTKASSSSVMTALAAVYGRQVAAQCQDLVLPARPDESWRNLGISLPGGTEIRLILPKPDADLAFLANLPAHYVLSGRPLMPIKSATAALKPLFTAAFRTTMIFHVLHLHLDPHYYDVNFDPSKATFVSELEPHLATAVEMLVKRALPAPQRPVTPPPPAAAVDSTTTTAAHLFTLAPSSPLAPARSVGVSTARTTAPPTTQPDAPVPFRLTAKRPADNEGLTDSRAPQRARRADDNNDAGPPLLAPPRTPARAVPVPAAPIHENLGARGLSPAQRAALRSVAPRDVEENGEERAGPPPVPTPTSAPAQGGQDSSRWSARGQGGGSGSGGGGWSGGRGRGGPRRAWGGLSRPITGDAGSAPLFPLDVAPDPRQMRINAFLVPRDGSQAAPMQMHAAAAECPAVHATASHNAAHRIGTADVGGAAMDVGMVGPVLVARRGDAQVAVLCTACWTRFL